MDIPQVASSFSTRMPDPMPYGERRRPSSRSDSQTSLSSSSSRAPMTIPQYRPVEAPPPLPPPKFNHDLANGHDLGWKWGNQGLAGGFGRLAPIKQNSSLMGGNRRFRTDNTSHGDMGEEMDIDDDFDRRGSTVSTIRSPSAPEVTPGMLGHLESCGKRTPSPSSASTQSLQGEKPLAQENLSRSSHAYDKHVLSKIGKGNSPPRHKSMGSGDHILPNHRASSHAKDGNSLQRLAVTDLPLSSAEAWSRRGGDPAWVTSPASAGVSPGTKHGWRDYNMDIRSPSVDSSAPSSLLDPDQPTRRREPSRHSTSGSLVGLDDSVSSYSRSTRGSYDQAIFAEPDSDFPIEETGGFRKLNIGDSNMERRLSLSKQGMKRRALSPPTDATRDDKALLYSADTYPKYSGVNNSSRSPNARQHPSHGSVSSVSSASLRNNSYASSVGFSIAGSSMTSTSSIDRDRQSPGPVSPLSESNPVHDPPYTITSVSSLIPSCPAITPTRPLQHTRESKPVFPAGKMSIQSAVNSNRQNNAARGALICECCPKKPKKFETEEELRAHEMEKQYTCQYCHNRFKNKNEAERHQNSLHLRRHSWACSAISGYPAAFHPSTTSASHNTSGPANDACGFCGEEFPNFPQQDWDRRIEHLTNVHKFNECNQAKKFYRADHFRQHLKHSHAGASGKWTNMLENACMKDEPAVESAGAVPIGEQSRGPSSLPSRATVMEGKTIDEAHDES